MNQSNTISAETSRGSSGQRAKSAQAGRRANARRQLDGALSQVRENPFAAVAGAVAVSAGLALLLPSSRREAQVMGEVADKIGEVARGAADTAVEAGRAQVETLAQTALASVGSAVIENVVAGAGAEQDGQSGSGQSQQS